MGQKVLIQSRLNRVFHWLTAASIFTLIVTGFYLSYPFYFGGAYGVSADTLVHDSVGFLAGGLYAGWVYYHVVTGGYKDIWFKLKDIQGLGGLFRYYFFLRSKPPAHGKYNPGQKIVYSSWVVVFPLLFITGMVLRGAHFETVQMPVNLQAVRFYHFLGSLWLVGTAPVHVYLSVTEDPAKLQAMLTGWVKK